MPFKTLIDKDITKVKTDVIVNSLGVNGKEYGRLCSNIIKASNSEELRNYIDSLVGRNYGETFITPGYEIKCKGIIHVVTPVKYQDKNEEQLMEAYLSVINLAIEKGYKSIAFSFLGTGANGYSRSESYNAAMEACNQILEREAEEKREIIEMNLIIYMKEESIKVREILEMERRKRRYERECNISELKSMESMSLATAEKYKRTCSYRETNLPSEYYRVDDFYGEIDLDSFFAPNRNYLYPFDFIDDYMSTNDIDDSVIGFNRTSLSPKRKYQVRKYKSLSKLQSFIFIWALNLDKNKAVQFMMLNGLSFNPFDKLDMFMMDYLDGVYGHVESPMTMREYVYSASQINFQF